MKKYIYLLLLACENISYFSFGFFTHEQINYNVVFTFQDDDLFKFYKKHIKYFSEHATDPDKRKFTIHSEGVKHFFNIDANEYGDKVLNSKWITYTNMCTQYGENIVKKCGILPWSILATQKLLTDAFEEKNVKKILSVSIDLAHYIADSCTPLHTTKNYDGQETDQQGIHSFWETGLPQLFIKTYNLQNIKAEYKRNLTKIIWNNIIDSYHESQFILQKDQELNEEIWIGKYAYVKSSKTINRMHSKKYAQLFHDRLGGQLEKQIRKAIKMIGDFILTSWIDAGMPNLSSSTWEE